MKYKIYTVIVILLLVGLGTVLYTGSKETELVPIKESQTTTETKQGEIVVANSKQFVEMFPSQQNTGLIPQAKPLYPDAHINSVVSIDDLKKQVNTEKNQMTAASIAYNLGMNYMGKISDLRVEKNVGEAIKYFKIAFDKGEVNGGYELIQIYGDTSSEYADVNLANFYIDQVNKQQK